MTFDTIKLDKGLYTTSKGFTKELEAIDPSENYIGTELEGLDAFERQLKRFDIKISGSNSDPISKFFQTSDSSALFPEYVSRAVRTGVEENDVLSKIIATTTEIDALDYRSIESTMPEEDKRLAVVGEGALIPETQIKVKDKLTHLYKHGRMLSASYEAIKYQKLDLFTITLKQIGNAIAASQVEDALIEAFKDARHVTPSCSVINYDVLVELWSSFAPYKLTTVFANSNEIANILKMPEFRDSNAGLNFHATGNMVTPLGADIVRFDLLPDNALYGLDKNYAVEKVVAGGVMTESDKLIDRQLERVSITTTVGFSSIFNDAAAIIN